MPLSQDNPVHMGAQAGDQISAIAILKALRIGKDTDFNTNLIQFFSR